ncbi:MAG TPA: hypothetical protein PK156_33765 [Polyangium sp.]|nr:hypothetical protein [Polyangium sp.]
MRKYRVKAASDVRIGYGIELSAGLRLFGETAGYAPSFEAVNNELDVAYNRRRGLQKPMREARAAFRFAQFDADQTIRMVHRAAEITDGGRQNGPVATRCFPNGLGPVVAPQGMRQIPPTEKLVADLQRCNLPGSDGFRTEWLPRLEAALANLKTAAEAYRLARKAYMDAFQDEVALRAEHYQAVDKIMGLVRAAFPNDRARQDVIFPEVDDGDHGDGDNEEDP